MVIDRILKRDVSTEAGTRNSLGRKDMAMSGPDLRVKRKDGPGDAGLGEG
jgi:hypothetical protein